MMINKIFNFFKKKEKEPKVIWWSTVEGLEDVMPIVPAKEVLPDWWVRVQKHTGQYRGKGNKGNIGNCPSFPEFMQSGYVVRLWCDLHLKVEPGGKYEWKSPTSHFKFDAHGDQQFKDFLPKTVQDNISIVLKPDCPWRVKTPPGWSVMQLPLIYHYNPIFDVLPGVIWSDIHHEINQQMVIKRYGEIFLKRGTPLAMYVPYQRSKLDFEVQGPTVENAKWANTSWMQVNTKFHSGYQYNQAEQRKKLSGKCPFHKE